MKTPKLITILSMLALVFLLHSCKSGKNSTDQLGAMKTKNGRFVKYKKYKPEKHLAINKHYKKKKITKRAGSHQLTSIDIKRESDVLTVSNQDLLAANDPADYSIYIDKEKSGAEFKSNQIYNEERENIDLHDRVRENKQSKTPSSRYSGNGGNKVEGFGLTGFIIAMLSLLVALFGLPVGAIALVLLIGGILSLILGLVSLRRFKKNRGYTGKGFAIASVIAGGVLILSLLLGTILFALAFGG